MSWSIIAIGHIVLMWAGAFIYLCGETWEYEPLQNLADKWLNAMPFLVLGAIMSASIGIITSMNY